MPVIDGVGISDHTPLKESGLGCILRMHMRVTKSIIAKRESFAHPDYHWFDINAGFGQYPECPGSPLVFLNEAKQIGITYQATFIEQDATNVSRLASCIGDNRNVTILCGDNMRLLPIVAGQLSGRRQHYGMLYTDPNGIPSFDLLSGVSRFPVLRKVDFLIYVSATSIKRSRRAHPDKYVGLTEYLATIDKRHWLLRDISTVGAHQWTFLLGTNWDGFPEYRKEGFYRADTKDGKAIMNILATTQEERAMAMQPELFDVRPI